MDMDSSFKSPRPPGRKRSKSRGLSVSAATTATRESSSNHDDQTVTGELTTNALLSKLEGLLLAKSNEIQLAGRLGEALLNQQAELEAKIRELENDLANNGNTRSQHHQLRNNNEHYSLTDTSDDESIVNGQVKEKLHALEEELQRWDRDNGALYNRAGLTANSDAAVDANLGMARQHSRPSTPPPPLPTSTHYNGDDFPSNSLPETAMMSPSASASRRQRNAQHRANDIEFATEIGQSLLTEVRRLQALLTERDAAIAHSKSEKEGMERSMESLINSQKSVEESLDKYREENWNLEVRNQEISTQLNELSSNFSKIDAERARFAKELANTREYLDTQKVESERLTSQVESMKNRHETDMANMRRTTAGLQREKLDLQSSLETARKEIDVRTRGIRRSVSAASGVNVLSQGDSSLNHGDEADADLGIKEEEEDGEDVFGTNRRTTLGGTGRKNFDPQFDSPGAGTGFDSPSNRLSENERLAHAQKTIQTLRAALLREKEAKMDLKRKLGGGGRTKGGELDEEIHDDDEDDEIDDILDNSIDYEDENDENQPEKRRRTLMATSSGRGRGRGRGRGALRGGLPIRRGSLLGRPPRGTQPSRLSSEVHSDVDEQEDGASVIEHDISMDSEDQQQEEEEEEELASFRSQRFDDERAALRASQGSLAGMDPAFADILPQSSSSGTISGSGTGTGTGGVARQTSLGSLLKNNRPTSSIYANDFSLSGLQDEQEILAATKLEMKDVETMTEEDQTPILLSKIDQLEKAAILAQQAALATQHGHTEQISALADEHQRDRSTFAAKEQDLQGQLEKLRKEIDDARTSSAQALEAAHTERKDIESRHAALSAEYEAARRSHAQAGEEATLKHRDLQQRVDDLLAEASQMQDNHAAVQRASKDKEAELSTQLAKVQEELSEAQRQHAAASDEGKKREETLSSRIGGLTADLDNANAAATALAANHKSQQTRLEAEIAKLQQELQTKTAEASKNEVDLRSQAQAAQDQNALLLQESTEQATALKERLAALEAEAERAKLAAASSAALAVEQQDSLKEQMRALQAELEGSKSAATQAQSQAEARVEGLQKQHNEALQGATAREAKLDEQIEELKKSAEAAAALALASELALKSKLDTLSRESQEAHDAHSSEKSGLGGQIDSLSRDLDNAKSAATLKEDQLNKRIEQLLKRAEEANQASQASEGDLQKQIVRLHQDSDEASAAALAKEEELRKQLLEAQRAAADAQGSAKATEEDLRRQLARLQTQSTESAASFVQKEADLNKRIDDLTAQMASLLEQLKTQEQAKLDEAARLRSELEALTTTSRSEATTLQDKIAALTSQHEQASKDSQGRIAGLENDLQDLKKQHGESISAKETLEQSLQARIAALLAESAEKERAFGTRERELSTQTAQRQQELEEQRKQAAQAAQAREAELLSRLAALEKEGQEAKLSSDAALMEHQSKVDALTQAKDEAEREAHKKHQDLSSQLLSLQEQHDSAQQASDAQHATNQRRIQELEAAAAGLAASHAAREKELSETLSKQAQEHESARQAALELEQLIRREIEDLKQAAAVKASTAEASVMTSSPDRSRAEDTTVYLSGMSSTAPEEDATTPTMESTPQFAVPQAGPSTFVRSSSVTGSLADDSSIAPSFKSFSRTQNTDYDTATETEGDFEDARETMATFDGIGNLSNASHSTILHSRNADSDQESEFGGSLQATPRYPGKRRAREPTITKEMGTSPVQPPKPVAPIMVDIAVQTDDLPVPSPTYTDNQRMSVATFGQPLAGRLAAQSETAAPAGPVILEKTITPLVSSASSVTESDPLPSAQTAEPEKPRPKMSIPPPPAGAPPKDALRLSTTPTFRPPRPTSPPPPELLQRAQTPTFLAPSTISRKRSSASDGTSSVMFNTPGPSRDPNAMGNMPFHRNEASFGASPAPLPHHRPASSQSHYPQPRATASAAQLRSSGPPIRYQAASSGPSDMTEFGGRPGAMTPINQMKMPPNRHGSTQKRKSRPMSSAASESSVGSSAHSRKLSMASSRTSEAGEEEDEATGLPTPGGTRARRAMAGPAAFHGSTDPAVIHAITQTMIGEFLFKYTRGTFSKETSDSKRHQRYVWIHPYTKTLYWTSADPNRVDVNQSKSKSVYIAAVRTEKDTNPNPPGLYQTSIIVSTLGREIKLTAPTKDRHDMWLLAMNYLLSRPDDDRKSTAGPETPSSGRFSSLGKSVTRSASSFRFRGKSDPLTLAQATSPSKSTVVPANRNKGKEIESLDQLTAKSRGAGAQDANSNKLYHHESVSEPRLTPKPSKRKMSSSTNPSVLYKRSDTPAAEYEHYIAEFGSPRSVRSYRPSSRMSMAGNIVADESLEIIDRKDALGAEGAPDGYEGLENVRACCNGEHDVGRLSAARRHSHAHHHHHAPSSKQSQAGSTSAGSFHTASRNGSVASRASSRLSRFEAPPPLPSLLPTMAANFTLHHAAGQAKETATPRSKGASDEPSSPTLRARSLSSTLRRKSVAKS